MVSIRSIMLRQGVRLRRIHPSLPGLAIFASLTLPLVCFWTVMALPVPSGDGSGPTMLLDGSSPYSITQLAELTPALRKAQPADGLPGDPAAAAPVTPVKPASAARPGVSYDDRPIRKSRTIRMLVTAYAPGAFCCGNDEGITASGYSIYTNGMALAAADTRVLPFHSIVTVPGYNTGKPIPVLDRGGKIKGNRLDILLPTVAEARKWGVKWVNVTVWEYADKK